MPKLQQQEYRTRIQKLREARSRDDTDIFIIYGDEYRRENLRYVSNYWPIFERGMLCVSLDRDPILLASPECEHIAREMSAWNDIRLVKEVGTHYVICARGGGLHKHKVHHRTGRGVRAQGGAKDRSR